MRAFQCGQRYSIRLANVGSKALDHYGLVAKGFETETIKRLAQPTLIRSDTDIQWFSWVMNVMHQEAGN